MGGRSQPHCRELPGQGEGGWAGLCAVFYSIQLLWARQTWGSSSMTQYDQPHDP
jgi:hypothetical protein